MWLISSKEVCVTGHGTKVTGSSHLTGGGGWSAVAAIGQHVFLFFLCFLFFFFYCVMWYFATLQHLGFGE
jgi:hypothetical protein